MISLKKRCMISFLRFMAVSIIAAICARISKTRSIQTEGHFGDIKENENDYVMEVEMPGMDKKDIHVDLKDGYLNISVNKNEKEDGGKKENYIHRERSFSCSRSYYVGDIRKEDIKAKYENGILNVVIPKEVREKADNHRIEIE